MHIWHVICIQYNACRKRRLGKLILKGKQVARNPKAKCPEMTSGLSLEGIRCHPACVTPPDLHRVLSLGKWRGGGSPAQGPSPPPQPTTPPPTRHKDKDGGSRVLLFCPRPIMCSAVSQLTSLFSILGTSETMATTQQSLFQGTGDGVSVIPRKATRCPGSTWRRGPVGFLPLSAPSSLSTHSHLPPCPTLASCTRLLHAKALPWLRPSVLVTRATTGAPRCPSPAHTLPSSSKTAQQVCFSGTVISPPLPREVPAPQLLPRPPAGWQVPEG